tara:strand:+ start:391 stop:726 length:336 start_codon:yes stop_codon:yes gene_type:complete
VKYYIDIKSSKYVFDNAETIKTVQKSVNENIVKVELFDYGVVMGWAKAGEDLRKRFYLNGNRVSLNEPYVYADLDGTIYNNRRPSWLPASMKIECWNDLIKSIGEELNNGC